MTRQPPPAGSRFQKGVSGNPKGRPKKKPAVTGSVFDVVIAKTLTFTQDGQARELTVDEALQQKTLQAALAGDRPARRQVLKMILKREKYLAEKAPHPTHPVRTLYQREPENADAALVLLGVACPNTERSGPAWENPGVLLEPWAVQAALSRRRGGAKLTPEQVSEIRKCARAPDTLKWPRSAGK